MAVTRVDVAVVTNVAEDHLGELGVHALADLTEVKFVVRRAADHLVLNADDPEVRRKGATLADPITWVSLDASDALIREHLAAGGTALLLTVTIGFAVGLHAVYNSIQVGFLVFGAG